MSRQLSRIRHLVSDIEQIQKGGQEKARAPSPVSLPPLESFHAVRASEPVMSQPEYAPPVMDAPLESKVQSPFLSAVPPVAAAEPIPTTPAKIFLQLTGDVAVELQIGESDERVEVRHIQQSGNEFIEIRFADGKAVHLPLKNVA